MVKKGIVESYISGITDTEHGEGYKNIFRYFGPEFITAFLLYSLPFWLDAYFVGSLKSTTTYATLGVTNNLLHFFVKIAEAISVGTVVLCGKFNGMKDYKDVGRSVRDAFWVTCIVGLIFSVFLYFGAYWIYYFYGVPQKMIIRGIPFLRLRALSVLFTFISLAFIGFMRGIKNTKTPMHIFVAGIITFVFFDYALIFGKFGLPEMGFMGSALASLIQYGVMLVLALGYVFLHKENYKYGIQLFSVFTDVSYAWRLIRLSIPVTFDKATMAMAYVWLTKMMCTMGKSGAAAFCVVKDMERFALLPAIAFAQVITLLVSNDYGIHNWTGIKSNIKKIVFLSSIMVFAILFAFSLNPKPIIQLFDKKGKFTHLASYAFPFLSVLVFFDLLQLILAGALRGAGNVRIVMLVRIAICFGYFVPVSYMLSQMNMQNLELKFLLIYGSFYIGNALMSLAYIHRFRGERWKTKSI